MSVHCPYNDGKGTEGRAQWYYIRWTFDGVGEWMWGLWRHYK